MMHVHAWFIYGGQRTTVGVGSVLPPRGTQGLNPGL